METHIQVYIINPKWCLYWQFSTFFFGKQIIIQSLDGLPDQRARSRRCRTSWR